MLTKPKKTVHERFVEAITSVKEAKKALKDSKNYHDIYYIDYLKEYLLYNQIQAKIFALKALNELERGESYIDVTNKKWFLFHSNLYNLALDQHVKLDKAFNNYDSSLDKRTNELNEYD